MEYSWQKQVIINFSKLRTSLSKTNSKFHVRLTHRLEHVIFFEVLHRFQDQHDGTNDDDDQIEDSICGSQLRVPGKLDVK